MYICLGSCYPKVSQALCPAIRAQRASELQVKDFTEWCTLCIYVTNMTTSLCMPGIKLHIIGRQTKHDASEVAVVLWDTWIYAIVHVYAVCIWVLVFTFSTTRYIHREAKLSSSWSSHMLYTEFAATKNIIVGIYRYYNGAVHTFYTLSMLGRWLLPYMDI